VGKNAAEEGRKHRSWFWALAALCGLALSTPGSGQVPDTLVDADLSVAGISYGSDSNEVLRVLGSPMRGDAQSDSLYSRGIWRYDGLLVAFKSGPNVSAIHIVGPRYATRRGLRVRDPVSRIRELYGRPCGDRRPCYGAGACYRYCRSVGSTRGVAIQVKGDRVEVIYLGLVIKQGL
jgi:hypothetical protein